MTPSKDGKYVTHKYSMSDEAVMGRANRSSAEEKKSEAPLLKKKPKDRTWGDNHAASFKD
jgi:hypothetical protein